MKGNNLTSGTLIIIPAGVMGGKYTHLRMYMYSIILALCLSLNSRLSGFILRVLLPLIKHSFRVILGRERVVNKFHTDLAFLYLIAF